MSFFKEVFNIRKSPDRKKEVQKNGKISPSSTHRSSSTDSTASYTLWGYGGYSDHYSNSGSGCSDSSSSSSSCD